MNALCKFSALSMALIAALALSACQRQAETPAPSAAEPATPPVSEQPAEPAITLTDVSERDRRYLVGITYPPMANKYPGLARALHEYSEQARRDLHEAVAEMGDAQDSSMMYDLTLQFTEVADTERVAAVAAAGTLFTGGAHGSPLVGRWVWLPQRNEMLTANRLIPNAADWSTVADYVREQLLAALTQRVDADKLEGAVRADVLRNGREMIREGTEASLENFDEFEPILAADGRLSALRFVFPPYQVGPYSDGEQSVEVPAAVLLPKMAAEYRDLFVTN